MRQKKRSLMMEKWWLKWANALERTLWTFVQTYIGIIIVVPKLPTSTDLKVALGAATIAALKSFSINTTVNNQMTVLGHLKRARER